MTTPHRHCKGCRPEHQVTEAYVAHLLSALMLRPSEHCVPDDIYAQRLQQCATCPNLHADGYTCALCGCIIQVMAKSRQRRCPQAGTARWDRYLPEHHP